MREPINFFVFQRHSVFMPFRYLYPECFVLIKPHQSLHPLFCLKNDICPVNSNCMEVLAKRVDYLFTNLCTDGKQLIAYFSYPDRPKSIRAGLFTRDLSEPRLLTLNRSAFEKFRKEGVTYAWVPTDEFLFIGTSRTLIPASDLLVKNHDRTGSS